MAKAKELTAKDFEAEVLKSDLPVLVDFWASWCQPCLMMAPVLDELAEDKDLEGKIKITKFNVEEAENQDLVSEYQVMSIPNMKVFKGGRIIKEIIGMRPKEAIKEELKEVIK